MQYKKLLRTLAEKEGISEQQLETEMQAALEAAGVICSVEEFILSAVSQVRKDYI